MSAAREDFTNRIGGQVRSMSRAGRMATDEWQSIADEFLDYLGALSFETPDLDTSEAKAALKDASEAAAGAVAYAAYHPHCSFQVFLEYVNFGMSYDPGEDAPEESVLPGEWIDALCLSVLKDKAKWHGEAFHFARKKFAAQAQGTPAGELATGLWPWSWTTPVTTRSTRRARRPSSGVSAGHGQDGSLQGRPAEWEASTGRQR
ncbi:hypothetical protein [Streptomyces mirabilis]|uniref:hypothetical protein n=1 Tax=Streptomyces mirabilis TaxID=68239 RepID=UPI0036DE9335